MTQCGNIMRLTSVRIWINIQEAGIGGLWTFGVRTYFKIVATNIKVRKWELLEMDN